MRYHLHSLSGDQLPHDVKSCHLAMATLQALRHPTRSCSLAEQAEGAGLAARKAIHDGWPDAAAQLAARAARYARLVLAAERGEA